MKNLLRTTAASLALSMGVPIAAQAQSADGLPDVETEQSVIDPARLAAAQKAVDYLFPLGTYERMMRGTMDQMIDSMLASLGTMRMGDLAGAAGVSDEDIPEGEGDRTLAEVSREADPHFEERMQISTRVMMDEMVTLMTTMEPAIREALTRIYARKFTIDQLGEMNMFFATDTGSAFARDYMMVFVDPEMMQSMMSMVPQLMQAMPDIMKKVEKATAHLPPVKAPDPFGSVEEVIDDQNAAGEDGNDDDGSAWENDDNWSKEDRDLVNRLSNDADTAFEKYYEALETAQKNAKTKLQKN
ncbi:DUF2059 domain-containing protein [Parasphingorhabdus sp.]|uniref:DUF2059 domain-containing protein n=1 Tax=Parasphingorhabdus sp. TaxID=2709688 RepID=UPI00326577C3